MKVERILCPTDYSEFSERALDRAVRLASWFEASVTVVHVLPPTTWMVTPDAIATVDVQEDFLCAQREAEAETLERFVAPYRGRSVALHTRLLDGDPSRLIQEAALELPADLVVMGTHGRSGFEHLVLGSVAEKVVRRATCPVLTVGRAAIREAEGPLFRRVLCALDLTSASTRTLDVALSLAGENMAQVGVLHVLEVVPGSFGSPGYRELPEVVHMRRQAREGAEEQLHRSVPPEARAFCSVSERVEEGAAWREILRVAEAGDADLIVLGAHSSSLLDRALFGSTVDHVVREARCPVLVVRETTARRTLREEVPRAATWSSLPSAAAR
jgi:nucleotide-binding universal stress UspA family protein